MTICSPAAARLDSHRVRAVECLLKGTAVSEQVQFYGPITVYARREGGEWVTYADPFGVAGDGATREEAIESVFRNLTAQLTVLAEEIREHGDDVEIMCPLEDDVKTGAEVLHALVYTVDHLATVPSDPARVQPLSARTARDIFARSSRIGVVPAPCVAL